LKLKNTKTESRIGRVKRD